MGHNTKSDADRWSEECYYRWSEEGYYPSSVPKNPV